MIGIELSIEGKAIVEECLDWGLIINCTHDTVLRLMPALNVTKKQADKALHILGKALLKFSSNDDKCYKFNADSRKSNANLRR